MLFAEEIRIWQMKNDFQRRGSKDNSLQRPILVFMLQRIRTTPIVPCCLDRSGQSLECYRYSTRRNENLRRGIVLAMMECGKWQLLTAFLLCCIQLPIIFSDRLLSLCAYTPPHRCRLVNGSQPRPILFEKEQPKYAPCEMFVDPVDPSQGTKQCSDGWEFFQEDPDEWTLINEWELVCEREYLANLLPYAYTGGTMIGGALFGALADRFGRRSYLLAALFLHTGVGISLHFCSLFELFAAGYSFQGAMVTAIQCLSFILLLETVPFTHHLKATSCLSLITPISLIILCLISWLIKNWRYIQLAILAPGIVCLGYFWLIPRSLPWLLVEGFISEAEREATQIARFNKISLPCNFRNQLSNLYKRIKSYSSESQHNLENVVCSDKIRTYTFILYYLWFIASLDTESLSSELPALKNNRYATLLVKGLMDTGMLIILYFFAQRFGPRSAQAFFLLLGGFQCIGSSVIAYFSPFKGYSEILSILSPVLLMLGKACRRSTIAANIFFTIKIFPTGVRGIGLGSCLFWTRAAHLISIHITSLESDSAYYFPQGVCGFLAVIGGCLTPFLPENCNKPLPNVAIEVEKNFTLNVPPIRRQQLIIPVQTSADIHFEEETETGKNTSFQELNVQEFKSQDKMPGPSHSYCDTSSYRASREDSESRLTDFEEELGKVWDFTVAKSPVNPLRQFCQTSVKDHYLKMNETQF